MELTLTWKLVLFAVIVLGDLLALAILTPRLLREGKAAVAMLIGAMMFVTMVFVGVLFFVVL